MRRILLRSATKAWRWKLTMFSLTGCALVHMAGLPHVLYHHTRTANNNDNKNGMTSAIAKFDAWTDTNSSLSGNPNESIGSRLAVDALPDGAKTGLPSTSSNNVTSGPNLSSLASPENDDDHNWMKMVFPETSGVEVENKIDLVKPFSTQRRPELVYRQPKHDERSKYFQPIDDKEAWLYSAFYQDDGSPLVRVVGMADVYLASTLVFCHLEAHSGALIRTVQGAVYWFSDAHNLKTRAIDLRCFIGENERPSYVKVSHDQNPTMVTNRLPVQYAGQLVFNFTVCFSPFHSNYSNPWQLVQTIELNRILGADHFVVYNQSMSSQVEAVLRWYYAQGIVTFRHWPFVDTAMWYFGQVTAINDCIHRHRNVSRFVVLTDVDEIIVPSIHRNWWDMLKDVSTNRLLGDFDFNDETKFTTILRRRSLVFLRAKHDKREDKNKVPQPKEQTHSNKRQIAMPLNSIKPSTSVQTVAQGKKQNHQRRIQRKHQTSDERWKLYERGSAEQTLNRKARSITQDDAPLNVQDSKYLNHFDSFSFRCAFYTTMDTSSKSLKNVKSLEEFPFRSDQRSFLKITHLHPLVDLVRNDAPFMHGKRSKVIVRPERISMGSIHNVLKHNKGYTTAFVKMDVALVHHYRTYQAKQCNTVDASTLRFTDAFIQAVKRARDKIPFLLESHNNDKT